MKQAYNNIIEKCAICPCTEKTFSIANDSEWVILYDAENVSKDIVLKIKDIVNENSSVLPTMFHKGVNEECKIACPMFISFLISDVSKVLVIGDVAKYNMEDYTRTISANKSVLKLPVPTNANMKLIEKAIESFTNAILIRPR